VVTNVSVTEGQHVKKGDLLLVVVSMKMEAMVRAPADGEIEVVCVTIDNCLSKSNSENMVCDADDGLC